jgi:hypothetical protein
MSAAQKFAWFNLMVVLLSLCAVVSLFPMIGAQRAQAGLAFLGLLGLSPFFLRRKKGQAVFDERDTLIQRRSVIAAYAAVWLVLFGGIGLAALFYGVDGAVPVVVIMVFSAYAVMVIYAVTSIATLVQYGRRC